MTQLDPIRPEMRNPARIVSLILQTVAEHVRPGISTFTLETLAEFEIKKHGVYSYSKGYHPEWARVPYPAVLCTNLNSTIAHGIPRENEILQEGDIITLDLGIIDKDGNCGDAAFCVPVGRISEKDEMLLRYAKKTTYAGISQLKDGVVIDVLARAMERKAGERHFVINHQLCSHAIGKDMHESPLIYNVSNHYQNQMKERYLKYEEFMSVELKEGMVVCIEPILTFADKWGNVDPNNGWLYRTKDRQNAAMFEHMVLITKDGYEILTNHFSN